MPWRNTDGRKMWQITVKNIDVLYSPTFTGSTSTAETKWYIQGSSTASRRQRAAFPRWCALGVSRHITWTPAKQRSIPHLVADGPSQWLQNCGTWKHLIDDAMGWPQHCTTAEPLLGDAQHFWCAQGVLHSAGCDIDPGQNLLWQCNSIGGTHSWRNCSWPQDYH